MHQLSGEKHWRLFKHAAETQKQNKVMANTITEQVQDIMMQIEKNSWELNTWSLLQRRQIGEGVWV